MGQRPLPGQGEPVPPVPVAQNPNPVEPPPVPIEPAPAPPVQPQPADPPKRIRRPKPVQPPDGVELPPAVDVPAGKRLVADPMPVPLQPLAKADASIPLPRDDRNLPVRYPWQPSPVVAVAVQKGKSEQGWDIWNVQSMTRLGYIAGRGAAI